MKRQYCILLCLLVSVAGLHLCPAQCGLQSGPMVGYSDMLEVGVWAQTKCAQEVQLRYWIQGHPDTTWQSAPVMTNAEHGFCAHLVADRVTPGHLYDYELWIDHAQVSLPYPTSFRTQTLWQYRTDPPDFTFVTGSCAYINEAQYDRPGKPYGGDYQIFTSILADHPEMMVWLGDNMYLREVDYTKTGIYRRYTLLRATQELKALLASVHHYAAWDDHDYGPNDSDGSFWGKDITLAAFKDFWDNPNYGVGGTAGITGTFFWQDCQFFLMDDRWYRGSQGRDADYYGQQQIRWLIQALRYSQAPFKFICTGGQILNDAPVFETYAVYGHERRALLDSLDKYNIKGVVFLTGDRHFSEISRMQTQDGDIFYDITTSPFTSSPSSSYQNETNHLLIPGSIVDGRNYALISVTGPLKHRVCRVQFKDANGKVQYEYTLE